jgi:hypothetical protein
MKKQIRVSAIQWDCSLPSDTYFGYHQTRTLSPKKYRTQTPFYADVLAEDRIEYHLRDQAEFDRELAYAIEAGIDYFSYVFYPEHGSRAHVQTKVSDCSHKVYELNYARRMHEKSALRDKIGMAAIMGAHPFEAADYDELAALTQQPYYERIDGRPLVYSFQRIREEDVFGLRAAVKALGGEMPLFVPMFFTIPEDANMALADGVCAYACTQGAENYAELLEKAIGENELRAKGCARTIPLFPTGWNPAPRLDIPSPWVNYDPIPYAAPATREELLSGGKRFSDWILESDNIHGTFMGHVMMFAWNEFEEGGWICPTYTENLGIDAERVETVSMLVKRWKEDLAANAQK